jgi:zinc protease
VEGLAVPTDEEVTRYINRRRKEADLILTQSDSLAIQLSEYAAMGDWRLFFVLRDQLDELRPKAVLDAARRYFQPSNRTAGLFFPTEKPERAPLPSQPDIAALVKGYRGKELASQGEAFDPTVQNIENLTQRITLESGMKVALLPKETRGDTVQAVLLIHYGSEAELEGQTTAAELVPPMLLRGSRTRSYQQIRDALDGLKADLNLGAESRPGGAVLTLTTVRDQLPAALELIADLLIEPSFPAADFEILRGERIAAREEQLQDPTAQAFSAAVRALMPFPATNVRYRPTPAEAIERLRAVQLADVKRIYERLWGGNAASLAIVGDFDPAAVTRVLDSRYASWKAPRPFERIRMKYREVAAVSRTIDTPDKEMAFVVAGHPLQVRDDSPDYPALELAGFMLGSGSSSRLWKRLREKEGWSYGAFGDIQVESLDEFGYLMVGARSAPQNAIRVRDAIVEEVRRFLSGGVTTQELAEAKKALLEQSRVELSYDDVLAAKLASGLYVGRTLAFEGELLRKIAALTPADITAAASKYVEPANLLQFLAGDLKKVGTTPP